MTRHEPDRAAPFDRRGAPHSPVRLQRLDPHRRPRWDFDLAERLAVANGSLGHEGLQHRHRCLRTGGRPATLLVTIDLVMLIARRQATGRLTCHEAAIAADLPERVGIPMAAALRIGEACAR